MTKYGLTMDLESPYFACFRQVAATSVVLTYPVPPFTTILGMLLNALGVHYARYEAERQRLQEALRFNLRPLEPLGRPQRELAKLLKLVGEGRKEEGKRPVDFPSSPVRKSFLVRPAYRVYLASESQTIVQELEEALRRPARPLYLGGSDDMVIVNLRWIGEVKQAEGREVWGLLPGMYEGCELIRLPLAFQTGRDLAPPPLLALPRRFPFALPEPRPLAFFESEGVILLPA
jgi:CRISPR-associated protein Cas5, N-terminal domain